MASTHQDNIATNETDEDNQDSLQQMIYQNLTALNKYCTKFYNIRRLNAEIFQVIKTALTSVRSVQAAHQTSIQAPANEKITNGGIELSCKFCSFHTPKLKASNPNRKWQLMFFLNTPR